MFCFVNDRLMQQEDAALGIRDLSILRGYGIFDFFRLNNNVPLFLDDHLERFFSSARQVYDQLPFDQAGLKQKIMELIALNQKPVSGIRIVLTGGYSPDAYSTAVPNLIITQEAIKFPNEESYREGVKLITYPYLRELPEVKTINYMTGIWLKDKIRKENAFDVLYTQDNHLLELTRSNFFIVTHDRRLITPEYNILKGVTRRKVLELASNVADVEEGPISKDDLQKASEAFLTGTTKKILPVVRVDDVLIGEGVPGDLTRTLMHRFEVLERNFVEGNRL